MSANKAYKQFKKQRDCGKVFVEHYDDCTAPGRAMVPINECSCDCYEKRLFVAGYSAAHGITQERRK